MNLLNFPGFTAIKNFAPFTVEFQWNSQIYILEAGQTYNMPDELAFAAIKNTVYKILPDGHTFSYALPATAVPEEEIVVKTNNLAQDYLFQDDNQLPLQTLSVPFADRITHRTTQKDFKIISDGKAGAQ